MKKRLSYLFRVAFGASAALSLLGLLGVLRLDGFSRGFFLTFVLLQSVAAWAALLRVPELSAPEPAEELIPGTLHESAEPVLAYVGDTSKDAPLAVAPATPSAPPEPDPADDALAKALRTPESLLHHISAESWRQPPAPHAWERSADQLLGRRVTWRLKVFSSRTDGEKGGIIFSMVGGLIWSGTLELSNYPEVQSIKPDDIVEFEGRLRRIRKYEISLDGLGLRVLASSI